MRCFRSYQNVAVTVLAFLFLQEGTVQAATLYFDNSPSEDGLGRAGSPVNWATGSAVWNTNAYGAAGSEQAYVANSDLVFGVDPDQSGVLTVLPQQNELVTGIHFLGHSVVLGDHSAANAASTPSLSLNGGGLLHVENQDSQIKNRVVFGTNVVKTGLGKLTLDHGNYASGGYFGGSGRTLTLQEGTLELKGAISSDALNVTQVSVQAGATLIINGPNIINNAAVIHTEAGGRAFYSQIDSVGSFSGEGWIHVGQQIQLNLASDQVFSGNLEGTSTLNIRSAATDPGKLVFTGANTFRGIFSFNPEVGRTKFGTFEAGHFRALQFANLNMDYAGSVYGESGMRFSSGVGTFLVGSLTANQREGVEAHLHLRDEDGQAIRFLVGNTHQNSRFTGAITGIGSFEKVGMGTLTLDRANTYTGDTVVHAGTYNSFASNTVNSSTLALDFAAAGAPQSQIISAQSRLVMRGGQLQMVGSATPGSSQSFATTHLGTSVSRITLSTTATATLNLGEITREVGGQVLFDGPTSGLSATHGITSTRSNTNGILGAWARIGGNWASAVSNGVNQNIVAFNAYDLPATSTLASSAGSNVKIGAASTYDTYTLGQTETLLHTLMLEQTTKRIVAFETDQTLRLTGGGLWFRGSGSPQHQLGLSTQGSVGQLTAGAVVNEDAELTVIADLTSLVYTKIVDNGTGKLTLVKAGAGDLHLYGGSTYTGGTIVTQGRINQLHSTALGANVASNTIRILAGGQVFFNSSTLNNDVFIAGNGWGETAVPGAIRLSGTTLNGVVTLTGNATIGAHGGTGISNSHLRGKITGDYQLGFAAGGNNAASSGGTFNLHNTGNDFRGGLTLNGIEGHTGAILDRVTVVKNGANEVIPHGIGVGDVLIHGGTTSLSTLDLNGFTETINGLQSGVNTSNAVVTNHHATAAAELKVGAHDGFASFSGILRDGNSGAKLAVTKIGAGTQDLGGANTYSGDTRIESGSLKALAANTFSANSRVILANQNTAILNLNGFSQQVKELSGGGYVNFGTEVKNASDTVLTLQQSTSSVYSGKIVGTGTLVKSGAGRLSLGGQNAFLGETQVTGGHLQVGVAGVGSTGSGRLVASSTSVISGSGQIFGRALFGSGTVLRPGDTEGTSVGTLRFEAVGDSLTLNSGSKVELQVASAESHDRLALVGNLRLDAGAQVEVQLLPSYQANWGDRLDLIDWGIVSGSLLHNGFNVETSLWIQPTDLMLGQGWSWAKDQFLSHGAIYVIPEPSHALLQLLALSCLGLKRRRR